VDDPMRFSHAAVLVTEPAGNPCFSRDSLSLAAGIRYAPAMISLADLVSFLDSELRVAEIADYPGAVNGLQLANGGRVGRIVAAVDASLPVIEAAAKGGPGLLIVHHGMFWQGTQAIAGAYYRKLKTAMDAGLAVYSSHLPLDVHPEWGNNILLAKAVGLINPQPFFEKKGLYLGLRGEMTVDRSEFAGILRKAVGAGVHLCPGGPQSISSIGIITGGAGGEVAEVAAAGVDTFVTGEGPHWSYPLAEELGINLFYAGHYATETFGVKRVAEIIEQRYKLPWHFIDHPTGL
jgi:dinuclear metal center YbgI/SA1388 family protein